MHMHKYYDDGEVQEIYEERVWDYRVGLKIL